MTQELLDFPHSLEAERSALGAVIVAPETLGNVATIIGPLDFFRSGHRSIFAAMRSLSGRGEAIDFVTLKEELARAGELDEAGGPAYLAALADGVPRSMNAAYYARIVKEKALAREAVGLCLQTVETLRRDSSALGKGLPSLHRDAWERIVSSGAVVDSGLPNDALTDAVDLTREGQQIEAEGIRQLVEGLIPNYGMLGFLIAYAKVGKTTFGLAMAAAIAMGRLFLERGTRQARVLAIAAEDPPEYTAWVARHLNVARGRMTFYRRSHVLDGRGLAQISAAVKDGGYGLVLISSWQAVVRGLIRDENDNAGAVCVVENVKAAARLTGIPWLIDAHSGKGEDQDDGADPSKAMRGASAAAGAADYTLSLRYANGAFGTQRRLSGKGRFVSFAPIAMDFDAMTSTYTPLGNTKDITRETTWRLISEARALTSEPHSVTEIARRCKMTSAKENRPSGTRRKQIIDALKGRPDVGVTEELRYGKKTALYRLLELS